jgi:RHS repeat-associated protein
MYYVHKDHLGSPDKITNSAMTVIQSTSFDAWGRRRNPDNWTYSNIPTTLFSRGYTGHEHLDQFDLINMNGRMYDPLLGRFLSPDPFVANAGFTQDYNRYSYVLNNPLRYTDPTGYLKYTAPILEINSTFGSNSFGRGGSMFGNGGGNSYSYYGLPGHGNGTGLFGIYYDWATGNYRSIAPGHAEVGWEKTSQMLLANFKQVTFLVYGGTNENPYQSLNGIHYSDGTSEYFNNDDSGAQGQGGENLTNQFNQRVSDMESYFGAVGNIMNSLYGGPILSYPAKMAAFGYIQYKGAKTEFMNPKAFEKSPFFNNGKGGYVNGQHFSPDDFGNYFYGVAAKSMGLLSIDAIQGAGIYAIFSGSVTDWTNFYGFFDEKKDTQMILRGYYGR